MIDYSILQNKKAAYFTLGCKLNFAETSTLGQQLRSYGVKTVEKGECADMCIINTCSVTEVADHKCRQIIHKMVKEYPGSFVVVMGCYAQLQPELISDIPGVDLVVGAELKGDILPLLMERMTARKIGNLQDEVCTKGKVYRTSLSDIRTFVPSCSRGNHTRYFLKVQDGCNYYCTYCTIPIARGRSRNGSIASLVEQARKVAQEGGKEIVITGVNIGDFGRSTGETFFDLIRALDEVENISRYRISSIEPNLLTDEIIRYVADSKSFMPHFHIPLQSGSDDVLKLMHRKYDTNLFRHKVDMIKEYMPHAFIGVDVMVGCRGELPSYFENARSFIDSLPVTQLHVFPYSERPGTKALEIPYVVSAEEKRKRSQQLLCLSEEKRCEFYASFIGTERTVLFESAPVGRTKMHGFTDNYIRVETDNLPEQNNCLVPVRLGDFNADKTALKAIPLS